jgi:hypothetical protein
VRYATSIACIALAACLGGCGRSTHASARPPPADVADQVRALSTRAIYFGHQSVGFNIMSGVEALVAGTAGATLRVVETSAPAETGPGVFAHSANGANGDPAGKIAAFERTMDAGVAARVDTAFFKFCFVDFDVGTDVPGVFASYQAALDRLRTAHPQVRFVHVTVPLRTAVDEDNAVRERFSNLMRQAYAGKEPIFDLALIESTRPDGGRELGPGGVPALVPAYTSDGGHLDATGQDVVARALAVTLAALR